MDNIKNCSQFNNCNHKDCENDFCIRKYKLDHLYETSLLSVPQRSRLILVVDTDAAHCDNVAFTRLSEIENNIVDFVNNGNNLYIHSGQCGNGKTSWAVRMIQSYFNKIWPKTELKCRALFISVPRFLLAIKDNISVKNDYVSYIKENIMDADLVVWDDIAAKTGTDFELNHLLSLIDGRIAQGKANIYTSNLDRARMYEALGERLTSRIANYSEEVVLVGYDKRQIRQESIINGSTSSNSK